MTTPAALVRGNCDQISRYRAALERLVTEPSSAPGGAAGLPPRPGEAPFPGNAQAFAALMVIWEHVPRLEAALRLAVTGHPGMRRGGSAGNFLDALSAIPALAAGLDSGAEAAAARILERLANLARCVPAIDEAQQWRFIPPRRDAAGQPVPACPYCHGYFLKAALDSRGRLSGRVECRSDPGCRDYGGQHPAAQLGTDEHGRPVLAWPDFTETAPDLDG